MGGGGVGGVREREKERVSLRVRESEWALCDQKACLFSWRLNSSGATLGPVCAVWCAPLKWVCRPLQSSLRGFLLSTSHALFFFVIFCLFMLPIGSLRSDSCKLFPGFHSCSPNTSGSFCLFWWHDSQRHIADASRRQTRAQMLLCWNDLFRLVRDSSCCIFQSRIFHFVRLECCTGSNINSQSII